MTEYRVNVSSVRDWCQCRFRWWAKWVMNRVPVVVSPALDSGSLYHHAHELAYQYGNLRGALALVCRDFRMKIALAPEPARPNALEAVETMEDVVEAMDLWEDKFPVDKVLEVEKAHEWRDPVLPNVVWLLRPDRVVISGKKVWHYQRRALAASKKFSRYLRLAKRHYHEHLYGEVLRDLYCRRKYKYGGTVFDLLRKLKYRTNVGKKNEATKTAEEMFYQAPIVYDLDSPLHASVMHTLRGHVSEMIEARTQWEMMGRIPFPNDEMNGGINGNSEDPYFRVLIGEVKLDDDTVFKDREDTYAVTEE